MHGERQDWKAPLNKAALNQEGTRKSTEAQKNGGKTKVQVQGTATALGKGIRVALSCLFPGTGRISARLDGLAYVI